MIYLLSRRSASAPTRLFVTLRALTITVTKLRSVTVEGLGCPSPIPSTVIEKST
ncbi:hypothetical protein ACQSSU_10235 [Micromonospora echinospora]